MCVMNLVKDRCRNHFRAAVHPLRRAGRFPSGRGLLSILAERMSSGGVPPDRASGQRPKLQGILAAGKVLCGQALMPKKERAAKIPGFLAAGSASRVLPTTTRGSRPHPRADAIGTEVPGATFLSRVVFIARSSGGGCQSPLRRFSQEASWVYSGGLYSSIALRFCSVFVVANFHRRRSSDLA
jgi:hypothetical protein